MPTEHLHITKNIKTLVKKKNLYCTAVLGRLCSLFFLGTTSSNIIQKHKKPSLGLLHSYLQKLKKQSEISWTVYILINMICFISENILLVQQLNDSETIHTIFAF